MATHLVHARTAKFISASILAVSLFAALTGCTPADGVLPVASSTATDNVAAKESDGFYAQFVRVIDGDTIKVQRLDGNGEPTGGPVSVRLLGIDAPEASACGGAEATLYLKSFLAPDDMLSVKYDANADKTDRFDRTLGYVYHGGENVGSRMVDTGNAAPWFPQGEPTPEQFDDYEQMNKIAMDQKKGVYGLCDTVGR